MAQVKITVRPNGPYRVEAPEGSIELVDVNGNQFDLTGKPAFSLCRCGGSVNKPFCDGTHSRIGFQGAELAVKKAEGLSSEQAFLRTKDLGEPREHRVLRDAIIARLARFLAGGVLKQPLSRGPTRPGLWIPVEKALREDWD